jgi:tetratricopeptide (TPR) repeat protein
VTESLDEILESAAEFLEKGQPEKAVEVLERSPVSSMESPQFWHLRGAALFDLGRFEEAAEAYDALMQLRPERPEPLVWAAESLLRLNRFGSAEKYLLRGLRSFPDSLHLLDLYCETVARAGQLEKARALAARIKELHPVADSAYRLQVLIEFMAGDDNGLLEAEQARLMGVPDSPARSLAIGVSLLEGGRVTAARSWILDALDRDAELRKRAPELVALVQTLGSPLLFANRLVDRYGRWLPWSVGIVIFIGLQFVHTELAAGFVALFGLFLILSWVAPTLVFRLSRAGRLARKLVE